MRRHPIALWLIACPALAALVYGTVYLRYRIEPSTPIDPPTRDRIAGVVRAALRGDAGGSSAALREIPARELVGPLWLSLYHDGELVFRQRQEQRQLPAAMRSLVRAVRSAVRSGRLTDEQRSKARIKIDLALGEAPLVTWIPAAFAKGLAPGTDGIALEVDGRVAYLLPDDLYKKELLAGFQPFFFMHEFRTGLDLRGVVDQLAAALQIDADSWRRARPRYFRFRVQSFVEDLEQRRALPVIRSRVPVERIDRAMVRDAVVRSADYVLRQLRDDGRFRYIYYPLHDQHAPDNGYSLPRHAGTTWFLSLAHRHLSLPRLAAGARRAMEYLAAHAVPFSCRATPYACVGSDRAADLGSAALATVAAVEYQQATGDRRFEQLARRWGSFLLWMQKANGDFCHQFQPQTQRKNCHDILLYYSGEATLALAKLHQLTGDRRYVAPLRRALDFLTATKYEFFLGQFFISEDHWTCIAAEAAYPAADRASYAEFCQQFGALNRRAQVGPEPGPLQDLHGAFAITPFFMPHNTPVGSRTEANVATYLLLQRRGAQDPELLETVRRSVRYLVDQQLRPESSYLLPNAAAAAGGITQTPVRTDIRIDYVQHGAAAMVRALPLIPEHAWSAADDR